MSASTSDSASYGPPSDGDLSIEVGRNAISGWMDARVMRSCERFPSDFDLTVTERYPTDPSQIVINPGDPCVVKIGTDTVLTGFVDRYTSTISGGQHVVRVQGRSKCEDLADCSAELSSYQFSNITLLGLAQQLAGKFKLTASLVSGTDVQLMPFGVALGETPFEIIERCARFAELLVYDDANGNLVLATAGGGGRMASGFAQGVNVQSASVSFTMDERFSEVTAVISSTNILQQYIVGSDGTTSLAPMGANQIWTEKDPRVPRYRPHIITSEQGINSLAIATKRAKWEVARRYGRSQAVRLVCDSWRDSAGTLWQPNAFAYVDLPALKIKAEWVISTVNFRRDADSGTTAELLLMPREAFEPDPVLLYTFDSQVYQSVAPVSGGAAR